VKWFKHISDSLDDPFIFGLMEEFGHSGYVVFFGVLEIYSREFSTKDDWILTEKLSYFRHKLLISCSKFKKILSKITKWEVTYNGDLVSIYIPKYKELLDESTLKKLREHDKSFRNASGMLPKSEGTDKEEDKDKEEDRDKKKEEGEDPPPFPGIEKEQPKKKPIPPTINEVKVYCLERKNNVDPEAWMAFYTSNGWMVGKNKMKDWKSAIITWEKRGGDGNGKSRSGYRSGESKAPGAAGRAQSDGRPYPIDAEY
jgi:hypothetical protein